MQDINQVLITGTATRDCKVYDAGDSKVGKLNLRVESEYQGRVFKLFLDCEVWGDGVKMIEDIREGEQVLAAGRLKASSYKKKDSDETVWKTILSLSSCRVLGGSQKSESTPNDQDKVPF